MTHAAVATVAALRETSILFGMAIAGLKRTVESESTKA